MNEFVNAIYGFLNPSVLVLTVVLIIVGAALVSIISELRKKERTDDGPSAHRGYYHEKINHNSDEKLDRVIADHGFKIIKY